MPIHGVVTPVLTSLAIALAGVFPTAFDPASAFVGGAPGWIYDDSNQSTLFQDAAGTTPVTALEQPVGLQLDLSQGLVLGSELVTNGSNPTATTGWSASVGSTLTVVANKFRVQGQDSYQAFTTVVGTWYKCSVDIAVVNPGAVYVGTAPRNAANYTTGQVSASATKAFYFLATATTTYVSMLPWNAGAEYCDFNNITVKKLAGNHRYQPTSANRPVWSARYNEMVKTESVSASPWGATNATGSVAAISLPPNISAAGMVTASAGAGYHICSQISGTSSAAGAAVTQLYWLRKGTTRWGWIGDSGDAVWHGASIDFDGAAITEQTNATATIVASSGSWFLIRLVYTRTSAGANRIVVGASPTSTTGGTAPNYTAAGTETVYATGFDCRPSDQATGLIPTYQRVNTATDYDSVGFPAGLRWNGSNSWMQNASVDFSGTNKVSVFVGVRKIAAAGTSVVVELSTSLLSNNGSFYLSAPSGAVTNDYGAAAKGTTENFVSATPYLVPDTRTMILAADIGAPSIALYVNGVVKTSNTTTMGTGNFGNYPAYFGARAGSSRFFNGLTFSNIAIGIALSESQIAAFESWTNARCRAYV